MWPTGTLVIVVTSPGETNSYADGRHMIAPVQESIVYIDGTGETDQFATSDGGVVSGFRLTRSDVAHLDPIVGTGSEDRLVTVRTGESDRSTGIGTVEVPASSSLASVLRLEAVPGPDQTCPSETPEAMPSVSSPGFPVQKPAVRG